MKNLRHFFILFCILIPAKIFPFDDLNLQFSQISTINGLSQNTVRSIIEDKKGFIWAGTLDGLNRYDGYHILSYKPILGSTNSLIDYQIRDVFQDKDGYLWVKTYKNEFCCYDPVTDSFTSYNVINGRSVTYTNYHEASNGDIWLWGNTDGCLRIKKKDHNFETTTFLLDIISGDRYKSRFLFEDSKGTIWIGGNEGLCLIAEDRSKEFFKGKFSFSGAVELNDKIYFTTNKGCVIEYDIKRNVFNEIKFPHENDNLINIVKQTNRELLIASQQSGVYSFNVNSLQFEKPQWAKDSQLTGWVHFIVDKNAGIWMYNHSGSMWYYNQDTRIVKKLELIPPDIINIIDLERYTVFTDSENLIWITTYGNGVFCYDPVSERLSNYKYNANRNSPASDYLLSIIEDRFGNIWIGSEYAGIIKIAKSNYSVRIIRPEKETSIGRNNNIRTVYEDTFNNFWVGTKNGSLYMYNSDMTEDRCIYKDINPYTIAEKDNEMWVGTKGKGLYIIDQKTQKETARYFRPNETNDTDVLSNNTIFSILRDNKNRMWIGTFGSGINLAEGNSTNLTFKHFFEKDGNRRFIRCIYQDSKGLIWAGTSDGLICFNPDDLIKDPKSYKVYQMNLQDKDGLNSGDIKSIYEDKDGILWIGTAGGGLNKYIEATDTRKEHFIAYTTSSGLSGDFVTGILEDKDHNLWISTESGITKFDKKNDTFMFFQFSEKTYGNHFNENANIYTKNGNMLWGSLDGLLIFNPESFLSNVNTPPVTLTNFFIYDQPVKAGEEGSPLVQSVSYSKSIKLNYKQNTFTIEFASLVLRDPTKNRYTYILENYDKQWSSAGRLNSATYKNLPPGKYIFKVKGANSDGVWNEESTDLQIEITPPFWKSIYAYIIYIVIVLVMLYVALNLISKFNRLNNNVKMEKELTNHKLRFFTNISHEFRTPLTLIRGAVENLNEQSDTPEKIKKQVKILSRNSVILTRLIDQLLEFRKIQNNVLRLDLEEIDIIEFCREIFSSFEEPAAQKNIDYQFIHDVDNFKMFIDRRKIDKIIYNLLSNAFKFTSKGGKIELAVSFDEKRQTCQISVKDNGIGVAKEKQHQLFSRFMQINFSSSGTGIGLSLVKEFVDVHKGRVWYENNREQGSVFNVELSTNKETYKGENFIDLPDPEVITPEADKNISDFTPEYAESLILPEIDDSTLSNYKMLIIDDNDDIRSFLTDEFSKYFMVDSAEDGKIGLQKAIETNPDLIVCDVMMPEMDGFEVTKRLKEDFQTCHIPIILLTAHSSIEHQLEGIQSGADAYIMKPFSLKYLVTRVFKLIEQREQLKKRFSSGPTLEESLLATTDKDKDFFLMIEKILEENLSDTHFSVDKFAELSKLGRTIFYKKIKGITGFSPNELIKIRRLKAAAEILSKERLTVSEVAFKVGFEDPFYFSKCFRMQYHCAPSKYGQPVDNGITGDENAEINSK